MAVGAMALVLIISACRDGAYNAAAKTGTQESLRRFIAQHPDDDNVPSARTRLAELAFAEARGVHSVIAYKRFLEEFPEEAQTGPARSLLEGLRFNASKDKGTAAAWRQFLEDHPEGAHAAQARATLRELELKQVLAPGADTATLKRAAAEAIDDAPSAEVQKRLDEQSFKEVTGPRGWLDYLRSFPAGKYRDQAKGQLLNAQLEGLLVSGQIDDATALVKRSPLAGSLKDATARLTREGEMLKLVQTTDPAVRRALPQFYRRSFEDLKDAMGSADARDRWEAAVELGYHVDVRVLDVLLDAIKTGRNDKVRRHAAESLFAVLKLLPPAAAEYEVFSRLEAMRGLATDGRVIVAQGVLLDGLSLSEDARLEYQKAFEPTFLDPLLLERGAQLRLNRKEYHSAAVAARLLSVWAKETIEESLAPDDQSVSAARVACAAADAAKQAAAVFAEVRGKPTDFPQDVAQFERQVAATVALTEARLRDLELKQLEKDDGFRTCFSEGAAQRLADADQKRADALSKLPAAWSGKVRAYAQLRDPSWLVRTAATTGASAVGNESKLKAN